MRLFQYLVKHEGKPIANAWLGLGHLARTTYPTRTHSRNRAWGFYATLAIPWRTRRWVNNRRTRSYDDALLVPRIFVMFRVRPWLDDVTFKLDCWSDPLQTFGRSVTYDAWLPGSTGPTAPPHYGVPRSAFSFWRTIAVSYAPWRSRRRKRAQEEGASR